jgi:hypothetical protein
MRFPLVSIFAVVSLAAVLAWLNTRETQTVTEPYYAPMLGAAPHPPPYEMKEMAISVHADRGWPIWHTRSSTHFATQNATAYVTDGGLSFDDPIPKTEPVRALIDLVAGALILGVALLLCCCVKCSYTFRLGQHAQISLCQTTAKLKIRRTMRW